MAGRSWLPHDQWSVLKARFFSSSPFLSHGFKVVCLIAASTVISLNSAACFTHFFLYPYGTQTHPGFHFVFALSSSARTAALSFLVLVHYYWADTLMALSRL